MVKDSRLTLNASPLHYDNKDERPKGKGSTSSRVSGGGSDAAACFGTPLEAGAEDGTRTRDPKTIQL